MPIVRIPDPNALPTIQNDFVRQNNKSAVNFLQVNKPIWDDATNIVQGAIFQIGGTVYYCNASTAIGGAPSAYIKLTPSGDGSIVTPTYVADLTGVSWNNAYNGYYDVGGNAYIFDELIAIVAGEIVGAKTRLWRAFQIMLSLNVTFTANPIFSSTINLTGGITENGVTHKTKIIPIGTWNMVTTVQVLVAHGLGSYRVVRSVVVQIRVDTDNASNNLPAPLPAATTVEAISVNNTNIVIERATNGVFDNSNYDIMGADGNRGWITIRYEV